MKAKKSVVKNRKKSVIITLSIIMAVILILVLAVPKILFTDYKGRPVTGPFSVAEVSAILVDGSRLETFEDDGSFREVPIHIYYPESVDGLEEKSLPLVLFSHGAFGYYKSNASTYFELASNGYVVISMDHPYHSFFTYDTTGKRIIVDSEFMKNAMNIGKSDATEAEVYDITSKWMDLREADMNFVLDTVLAAADGSEFGSEWFFGDSSEDTIRTVLKHIKTDAIGLMGHSLGGATSVTVGRRDDVKAVIDFDGTMIGEEIGVENGKVIINDEPYTTPLLCFDSQEHHDEREAIKNTDELYSNNVILENAEDGYSTYFAGSMHMDYTDLPLFSPGLAKMLGSSDLDHEKMTDQVNAITLQFFDCYLKGVGEFNVNEKYEID